jgi:hypothetical protein
MGSQWTDYFHSTPLKSAGRAPESFRDASLPLRDASQPLRDAPESSRERVKGGYCASRLLRDNTLHQKHPATAPETIAEGFFRLYPILSEHKT